MADILMRSSSHGTRMKKQSTRVDLTPMVDLGFLLITFFVFTTSMASPKVLDMMETKDGKGMNVPASGSLTILLGKDHRIFYYHGVMSKASDVKKSDFKSIRNIIAEKKKSTSEDKLMISIKSSKQARFKDVINIIDEMKICGITSGHFAEVDMKDEEETGMEMKIN